MRDDASIFLQQYRNVSSILNFKLPFFNKRDKIEWRSLYQYNNNEEFSVLKYLHSREVFGANLESAQRIRISNYQSERLPPLLKEREFKLQNCDKVFSSHWISHSEIVMSTKSSRLMIMNVETGRIVDIPVMSPSEGENDAEMKACGIYGIAVNESQTLLATGTHNNIDIAVYRLPGFVPVAILKGHSDLVFSLRWLSDNQLVSGSRDFSVAVWNLDVDTFTPNASVSQTIIQTVEPTILRKEHRAKVRSLQVNANNGNMLTLSGDGTAKLWDVYQMEPVESVVLAEPNEAVCTGMDASKNLYSIGSQSQITIIDPRVDGGIVHSIESVDEGYGVRCIAWRNHVLTIGGGLGHISFHDLRTQKYIPIDDSQSRNKIHGTDRWTSFCHQSGSGWLNEDYIYHNFFTNHSIPNAVYTASYDDAGSRLFTAGGPLQLGLKGNYMALWE